MNSHLLWLVLYAVGVSTVFATLARTDPRAQLRLALLMASGFLGVALLLGWLMYPIPL